MADKKPKALPLPLLPLQVHPLRPDTAVWAVGKFLFAYDLARGVWEQSRREIHEDTVRALDAHAVSSSAPAGTSPTTRWISAGDDKVLASWEEQGGEWKAGPKLSHSKKLTAAAFDPDGRAVFADRFGDVWRWDLSETSEAELLLSHLAIVTVMAFSPDGKWLLTGDNHEKVRVSRYPLTAEIACFCLGHTAQITGLAMAADAQVLLSAAADKSVRLWSLEGQCLSQLELGRVASSLRLSAAQGGAGEVVAIAGCEDPPGLVTIKISSEKSREEPLAEEAPQAVAVQPGGAVLWIDRRGHLRRVSRDSSVAADGVDVFEGEDLPPALVALSKYAGLLEDQGEADDAMDEGEAAGAKRRRPK